MPNKLTNSCIRSSKRKKCSKQSVTDETLGNINLLNENALSGIPKKEKLAIKISQINENSLALMSPPSLPKYNEFLLNKSDVQSKINSLGNYENSISFPGISLNISEKERNELFGSDVPVLMNSFSVDACQSKDVEVCQPTNTKITEIPDDDDISIQCQNSEGVPLVKTESILPSDKNTLDDDIIIIHSYRMKKRKRIYTISSDESDVDEQVTSGKKKAKFRKHDFIIKKDKSRNRKNNCHNTTTNKSSPNHQSFQMKKILSVEPDIISSCKPDSNAAIGSPKMGVYDKTVNDSKVDGICRSPKENSIEKNVIDKPEKKVESINERESSLELNKSSKFVNAAVNSPPTNKMAKCDNDKLLSKLNTSQDFSNSPLNPSNKKSPVISNNIVNEKRKSHNEKTIHKSSRKDKLSETNSPLEITEKNHDTKKPEKHKSNTQNHQKGSDSKANNSDQKGRKNKVNDKYDRQKDKKNSQQGNLLNSKVNSAPQQGKKTYLHKETKKTVEKVIPSCKDKPVKIDTKNNNTSNSKNKPSTPINFERVFKISGKTNSSPTNLVSHSDSPLLSGQNATTSKKLNSKSKKDDILKESARSPILTSEGNHSKSHKNPLLSNSLLHLQNVKISSATKKDSFCPDSPIDPKTYCSTSQNQCAPAMMKPSYNENCRISFNSKAEVEKCNASDYLQYNKRNSVMNNDVQVSSDKRSSSKEENSFKNTEVPTQDPIKAIFEGAYGPCSLNRQFNEIYAFECKTQVIDGCEMLSLPKLDLNISLCDVSPEKINVNQRRFSNSNFKLIKVPHVRSEIFSDVLSSYCSNLLNVNNCDLGESCKMDHKFTESMWSDLNDFNKWWSHVEKLFNNCNLISCDVFTSICSNLLKMKKRNLLLSLCVYLAERETDCPDYFQETWSMVVSALEQTAVQKKDALQIIIQHVCDRIPNLPINELQKILLYLGVENENSEFIWQIYDQLRHIKTAFFLLPRLFNAIISNIIKNPFCKPEGNFIKNLLSEVRQLPASCLVEIDLFRFEKLNDFLSRNNMLNGEINVLMVKIKKYLTANKNSSPNNTPKESHILRINSENEYNSNPSPHKQPLPPAVLSFEEKVISCLNNKNFKEMLPRIIKEYSHNSDVVSNLSTIILNHLNKSEEWYVLLKSLFGSEDVKNPVSTMYKVFDMVSSSLISDLIEKDKWKSAYDVYRLLLNRGIQLPAGVFVMKGMSQVRRIILCCELCCRSDDLERAVSLIMDNDLHLDNQYWSCDSIPEDVIIVRQVISLLSYCLINKRCFDLVLKMLTDITKSQKSIQTPFDVLEFFEIILIKLIEANKFNEAERVYFQVMEMVQVNDHLSKTFCRIALIILFKHGITPEVIRLFKEGISLNIYPALIVSAYKMEVYSFWQREEMAVYLDQWFDKCARLFCHNKLSPPPNILVRVQIRSLKFIDERRKNVPIFLSKADSDIRYARSRLQSAMTDLNPPLLVNLGNDEGYMELDSSSVKDMLFARIDELKKNPVK